MRRRTFLGGSVAIVAGLPSSRGALAEQLTKPPVIGFLSSTSPGPFAPFVAAFHRGLSETGYVEGQNVAVEYRWAQGQYDRLPALAADLVERRVDVIVTSGGDLATLAAKNATSSIPIVFIGGGDPVEGSLVASLARPGGNLTGVTLFNLELWGKRVELLSELVPEARVLALLVNTKRPGAGREIGAVQEGVHAKGLQLRILGAATEREIDAAFASLVELQARALLVGDPTYFGRREQIVALAARYKVPTIYDWREYVADGGLINYGTSLTDTYRNVGTYVGKILRGAKPVDLPIQQPTRFELVVNLKTAKALGLTIPPLILARADEVIE